MVTTSQTISSDSMVSVKRIQASVILHLTCHDYEKSRIAVSPGYSEESAIFINQSAVRAKKDRLVTRAEKLFEYTKNAGKSCNRSVSTMKSARKL